MNTDPTTLEVLDVEVTPLPSPLRLAQPAFLATLKEVEGQITALKITDAASAQLAASLNSRLTAAGKLLEDTRAKLKAPVLEQGRKIDEAAKAPALRITLAKASLQRALTAWDQEQLRKAHEIEQARQKELARLEQLRVAEERERQRKADELARLAAEAAKKANTPAMDVDFGDDELPDEPPQKTATEIAIEQVKHAPVAVVERPVGVSYRVALKHTVVNVKALPEPFVVRTANDAAIRAAFTNGWRDGEPLPECEGVKFEIVRTPIATGRSVF